MVQNRNGQALDAHVRINAAKILEQQVELAIDHIHRVRLAHYLAGCGGDRIHLRALKEYAHFVVQVGALVAQVHIHLVSTIGKINSKRSVCGEV